MICFINRYNLLNTNQYGFSAGQNAFDALTDLLDKAYDAIDQNRVLLTTFLDFSKAFDTVDHEITLKKMYYYSFRALEHQIPIRRN